MLLPVIIITIITLTDDSVLASVEIEQLAPKPHCCIGNNYAGQGLIGTHYDVSSAPVEVIDSKTLRIKQFSFSGTQAPDGWILVGEGEVDKEIGQKAAVLLADGQENYCPILEDHRGDADLFVRLPTGVTVYDINYLSVYCYAYGVDFGHVNFRLSPDEIAVPGYIPPIRHLSQQILKPIIC
ncbi:unnamed protein product [Enterobius vermicularis]|uniref:DM13 domain-containing protein n=1 Tax=Enterobius vermicularis TaxID=51028 RepID=A0A0N4V4Y7_ENTVE|nr:unnamed protein product [Enterobius vermicularis]